MKVQIVTGEHCPSCDKTRQFLDKNCIKYKEVKLHEYRDKDYLGNEIGVPKVLIWEDDIPVKLWTGYSPKKLMELVNSIRSSDD